MTVTNVAQFVRYSGNGSNTGPFPFSYPYNEATDLVVKVDGVLKTITTDYTVSSTGTDSLGKNTGANINFVTAPPTGTNNISIRRSGDYLQDRAISGQTSVSTTELEVWLDDQTMQAQDAKVLAEETNSVAIQESVAASVAASEAAIADELAAAQAAQTAAESARDAAQTSETNAANSASNASISETNAATSETSAAAAQAASESARDLSQEWAENNENVAVTGTGDTGFSSKHYSIKTQAALASLTDLTDGVYTAWVERSTDFQAQSGARYLVDAKNNGAITITEPSSLGITSEVEFVVKATDVNTVTFFNNIQGYAPLVITADDYVRLKYDPDTSNWVKIDDLIGSGSGSTPSVFTGTDGISDGVEGLVPEPVAGAGDIKKPIFGSGNFEYINYSKIHLIGNEQNVNYTAVNGDFILADTSGGTIEITLPTPQAGNAIAIKDFKGTFAENPVLLKRAITEAIEGVTGHDFNLRRNYGFYWFVFSGVDNSWHRVN